MPRGAALSPRRQVVGTRLTPAVAAEIERLAAANKRTRSTVMRILIERGLKALRQDASSVVAAR